MPNGRWFGNKPQQEQPGTIELATLHRIGMHDFLDSTGLAGGALNIQLGFAFTWPEGIAHPLVLRMERLQCLNSTRTSRIP